MNKFRLDSQDALETASKIKEQRDIDLKQLKIDYTTKLNEEVSQYPYLS